MHAVWDRNPNHGIHFRGIAKNAAPTGGDHLHQGHCGCKLEGRSRWQL